MNPPTGPVRLVCFSAYSGNLRYTAFVRWLREDGFQITESKPHGPPGAILELVLTFLPNCWLALTAPADLAAGFKPQPNITIPLLICKLRGIPTWLDVDDLDHAYREGCVSKLVELLQWPFPRLFRILSYHNDKLREFLVHDRGCAPDRLLRIEQGVDCRLFSGETIPESVAAVRQRYRLAGRRIAVYTAHLNVASDLEPVLQAWQHVAEKMPEALLLVVGGGPMREHFEALTARMGLANQVKFSGEVSHTEVPAYFAVADVALLYFSPRLVNDYRCSLKLREYFAAGVKVVCNDFGELKNYPHLTYQCATSVAAFAAEIMRVLSSGGDGREGRAREYAQSHLHWPRIVAEAGREICRRAELPEPPGCANSVEQHRLRPHNPPHMR